MAGTTEKPLKTHSFKALVTVGDVEYVRGVRSKIVAMLDGDEAVTPDSVFDSYGIPEPHFRRAMKAVFVGGSAGTHGVLCSLLETAGDVRVVSRLHGRTTVDRHAFARFETAAHADRWLRNNLDMEVGRKLTLGNCSPRVVNLDTFRED